MRRERELHAANTSFPSFQFHQRFPAPRSSFRGTQRRHINHFRCEPLSDFTRPLPNPRLSASQRPVLPDDALLLQAENEPDRPQSGPGRAPRSPSAPQRSRPTPAGLTPLGRQNSPLIYSRNDLSSFSSLRTFRCSVQAAKYTTGDKVSEKLSLTPVLLCLTSWERAGNLC